MKGQNKQMLVMVLILVFLVGAFFGLKQYNKVQGEKGGEETGEVVADVSKEDIVKLSYDYEGVTYTFEKVDGTWYYAEDHSQKIMQYLIDNMALMVGPMKADQVIENVTDLSQYGLTEPSRTISFETADASYTFEVGDYNSASGVYYLHKPSETTVYAVPSEVVSIFNKTLEDVVDTVESAEE